MAPGSNHNPYFPLFQASLCEVHIYSITKFLRSHIYHTGGKEPVDFMFAPDGTLGLSVEAEGFFVLGRFHIKICTQILKSEFASNHLNASAETHAGLAVT